MLVPIRKFIVAKILHSYYYFISCDWLNLVVFLDQNFCTMLDSTSFRWRNHIRVVYLLTYNRLSNRRLPATASLFLETKNFLLWTLAETYLSQSSLENHHRDQASVYLTVSKTDLWLPTLIINYEFRCIHLCFYKLNLVM